MDTNGLSKVEDTEMAESDGEKVVTMMDVLQEEQDFEDDANAVLGASDEKNCTYSKGYIKRQAIYVCLTCCPEAKFDATKRAGVCLACSLNCHDSHDLVELYTKRNFRCDCGNPKFNSHPCQYTSNKSDLNEDNNYNQNFSGLYCTCQRPYPDPGSPVEDDEMIQCIICEDWLHASHLETTVPGVDQYEEMVCKDCMEKNDFLYDYSQFVVNIEVRDVDVIGLNGTDTQLINNDSNEKLENGTCNSTDAIEKSPEEHINFIEKTSDMHVDDVQNETSMENKDITGEKIEETEPNNITMDTDVENSNSTSHVDTKTAIESADDPTTKVSPEESHNYTEKELDETTKSESKDSESIKIEQSTLESKETVEESIKENDSNPTEASEESEDALHDNVDKSQDIKNSEITETKEEEVNQVDTTLTHPTESADGPENKDAAETEEIKPQDAISNVAGNGDDESKIDSKETNNKQEENISTTNENDSTETSTGNDISPSESEQPLEDAEINTDITDNETVKNEANLVTKEQTSTPEDANKDIIDEPGEIREEIVENKNGEIKDNKRKLSIEDSTEPNNQLVKKPKINEESNCIRPKGVKRVHKGATFWPSDFRQKLCTCNECLSMYKDLSVLFLIDPEDTVLAYTALGKEKVDGRATQYEQGLEALSSLDRVQQINALTEYNKMKDKLLDFLKSFKDRKEVVKEEDIKAFFAGMKPKREPDGVYFCR